jgi:hypothetical protein
MKLFETFNSHVLGNPASGPGVWDSGYIGRYLVEVATYYARGQA